MRILVTVYILAIGMLASGCQSVSNAPKIDDLFKMSTASLTAKRIMEPGHARVKDVVYIYKGWFSYYMVPDVSTMRDEWKPYEGKKIRLKKYVGADKKPYLCAENIALDGDEHVIVFKMFGDSDDVIFGGDGHQEEASGGSSGVTCEASDTHGLYAHYHN